MVVSGIGRILGTEEPVMQDHFKKSRARSAEKDAKRLMRKGRLKEAAKALTGIYDEDFDDEEDVKTPAKPAASDSQPAAKSQPAESKPTEPQTARESKPATSEAPASEPQPTDSQPAAPKPAENSADELLSRLDEAASAKVAAATYGQLLQPAALPQPTTAVVVEKQPQTPLPQIDNTQNTTTATDGDDASRAHTHAVAKQQQPTKAPVEMEEENMNADVNFYMTTLGNAAYRFDAGLDKEPSLGLKDYVKSVIARDADIIDEIFKDYLPQIIAKNPKMIPDILEMIKRAEDQNIPIQALYINAKDPESQDEYASWEEATASIQKEIDTYGVDPTKVFKTIWRQVNDDGSLGDQVSDTEVVDFIENRYHGDKEQLKKLLRVKYVDKKPAAKKGKATATQKAQKPQKDQKADDSALT